MQLNTSPANSTPVQGNAAATLAANGNASTPANPLDGTIANLNQSNSSAPAIFDKMFGIGADASSNTSMDKLINGGSWSMNDTQSFFNIFNPMATSMNPLSNVATQQASAMPFPTQMANTIPATPLPQTMMQQPVQQQAFAPQPVVPPAFIIPSTGALNPLLNPNANAGTSLFSGGNFDLGSLVSQITAPIPAMAPPAATNGMIPQGTLTADPTTGFGMQQNPLLSFLSAPLPQAQPQQLPQPQQVALQPQPVPQQQMAPGAQNGTPQAATPTTATPMNNAPGLADDIAREVQANKQTPNPLELAQMAMRGEALPENNLLNPNQGDALSALKGQLPADLMSSVEKDLLAKQQKDSGIKTGFSGTGNAELDARADALTKLAGKDKELANSVFKDLKDKSKDGKLGDLTQAPPTDTGTTTNAVGGGGTTTTGSTGTEGTATTGGDSISGQLMNIGTAPSQAETQQTLEAQVAAARKAKDPENKEKDAKANKTEAVVSPEEDVKPEKSDSKKVKKDKDD